MRNRTWGLLAALLALSMIAASCGGDDDDGGDIGGGDPTGETTGETAGETTGETAGETAGGTVLRTAFSADPAPLDPATYYEAEGLLIMTGAYEGLLDYVPDSPELQGLLATDWDVTDDGLTYTFTLRDSVTFSDGTPFDAEAAVASLQRQIDMQGGPSYMLADVASITAPDDATVVIELNQPVGPFLDYLASPYGPKMVSPTAVADNEVDGDMGAAWLAENTAGTGPYVLTGVEPAVEYTLEANESYWGDAPHFERVEIAVIPDFSTQRIELETGSIDMVMHGLTTEDYNALDAADGFQVQNFPALFESSVWLNPDSAVFADIDVRAALRASLDSEALTEQVFGDRAVPSVEVYPAGMLPDGSAPDGAEFGSGDLADALAGHAGESVVVGYYGDGALQRMADLVQLQLQDAGLDATAQEFNPTQVFALPTDPSQRPDLLIATFNPDAAHPDTWARIYYYTDAPVNFLGCSVPEADALLDQALVEPDPDVSADLNVEAALLYRDSHCWLSIAEVRDTIAARARLTGWVHQPPWVFTVSLASLEES